MKKKFFGIRVIAILLGWSVMMPLALASTAQLVGIRSSHQPGMTRLVLDLSQQTTYRYFTLQNPDRLVIDLTNAVINTTVPVGLFAKSTVLKDLRMGRHRDGMLRIVIDARAATSAKLFLLASGNGKTQARLVVDISRQGAKIATAVPAESSAPIKPVAPEVTQKTSAAQTQTLPRLTPIEVPALLPSKPIETAPISAQVAVKAPEVLSPEAIALGKRSKPPAIPIVLTQEKTAPKVEADNFAKKIATALQSEAKSTPVLTVSEEKSTKLAHPAEAKAVLPTSPPESIPLMSVPLRRNLRPIVVVIDPGHGGKDPGAMGPHGIKEKNVVLAIAKDMQRDLSKIPGIKAYLTRTGDYYIPLRQRLEIARKDKADIFIAVHADAFKNQEANGASVFALSQRGASSEAARWLAQKENYSELGGVNLDDKSYLLRSVLLDLSQTATIGDSLKLGNLVLHALGKVTPLHNRDVEQAPFVVLKSPDIPSLLIETGFISNPREERNLNTPSYQQELAAAVTRGVNKYFSENPPQGTLFAALHAATKYRVVKGDSLDKIAAQYGVSAEEIRLMNHLTSNELAVGEYLYIPQKQT